MAAELKIRGRNITLVSTYFLHTGYSLEMHSNKKHMHIIGGDSDAQKTKETVQKGHGRNNCVYGEANTRGSGLKQWMMVQGYIACNTTFGRRQTISVSHSDGKSKADGAHSGELTRCEILTERRSQPLVRHGQWSCAFENFRAIGNRQEFTASEMRMPTTQSRSILRNGTGRNIQ